MNRDCHGDRLLIDGHPYWRCLRDGVLVPGELVKVKCHNCGRDASEPKEGEVDCGASYQVKHYKRPGTGCASPMVVNHCHEAQAQLRDQG